MTLAFTVIKYIREKVAAQLRLNVLCWCRSEARKYSIRKAILRRPRWLFTRDAEAGSGPFSVEAVAEARKSYRFRIGYLNWRVTWRKSFVHFPMWIKRWSCTI